MDSQNTARLTRRQYSLVSGEHARSHLLVVVANRIEKYRLIRCETLSGRPWQQYRTQP